MESLSPLKRSLSCRSRVFIVKLPLCALHMSNLCHLQKEQNGIVLVSWINVSGNKIVGCAKIHVLTTSRILIPIMI